MSLRSLLFPHVVHLETEVKELKAERDALLNRLLHAYSGYELRQSVPSYADAAAGGMKPPTAPDEVMGKGIRSNIDLMAEYEEACLQEAEGIADITLKAARDKAERENQEAADEYERNRIRARAAAAAESGHRE